MAGKLFDRKFLNEEKVKRLFPAKDLKEIAKDLTTADLKV